MFSIELIEKNKSKKLYQWDINRYIKITVPEGIEVSYVDFAHGYTEKSIRREVVCSASEMTVKIPNSLLQRGKEIRYWFVCDDATIYGDILVVAPKAQPPGYVLPEDEDEVFNYTSLEKRITDLEKNGGNGMPDAVQYVEQKLTEEQQAQARANIGAADAETVCTLSKDKADRTELPSKLSDLENDLDLEVEGTVEITSEEPTKESTVLIVDPNAEDVNLYTAEEIDAMFGSYATDVANLIGGIEA